MNYLKNRAIFCLSIIVSTISASVFAFAPAQAPLCLVGNNKPMTMLIMGRDHTLYYEAYNDASNLDTDAKYEISFDPKISYYGYFDPTTCYNYESSGYFSPKDTAGSNGCRGVDGSWHGGFLNYVTMSRIDVVRKVLYGGKRVTLDGSAEATDVTYLQRAYIPLDAHSWAKQFPEINNNDMGYQIKDYADVSSEPDSGKYVLFASTKDELWVKEQATETAEAWASQERKSPGASGMLTPAPNNYYKVRVKVCEKEDANCQAYGAHFKPVGILQTVGIENNMQFGLITGSYDKNLSGGKLRKNVSYITDEINVDTGVITRPSGTNGNIITNINNLSIHEFGYPTKGPHSGTEYRCGWVRDEPLNGGMRDGLCRDWGNPIGEMVYESLRYFAGATAATPAFAEWNGQDELKELSTGVVWKDPFAEWVGDGSNPNGSKKASSFDSCLLPYNLVISDLYPTYDGDSVPDNAFDAAFTGSDVTPSMKTALATISTDQGITGNKYFIGETYEASATDSELKAEYNPTAKTINNLAYVRGLAPFSTAEMGSYSSSAMAYWGRTNDLRPSDGGTQIVKTLVVALASPVPEFKFTFQNAAKTVRVIPFAKTPLSSVNKSQSFVDLDSENYRPTNSVLDFFIKDQDDRGNIKEVSVSFDDLTQGGDHDMDAIVTYKFDVTDTSAKQELKITTEVTYSGKDTSTQHLGYIISGTSNMSATGDGTAPSGTLDCESSVPRDVPHNKGIEVKGGSGEVIAVPGSPIDWYLDSKSPDDFRMSYDKDEHVYYANYNDPGDFYFYRKDLNYFLGSNVVNQYTYCIWFERNGTEPQGIHAWYQGCSNPDASTTVKPPFSGDTQPDTWRYTLNTSSGTQSMKYDPTKNRYYAEKNFSGGYHVSAANSGYPSITRYPVSGTENYNGGTNLCLKLYLDLTSNEPISTYKTTASNACKANNQGGEKATYGGIDGSAATDGDVVTSLVGTYVFKDRNAASATFYEMLPDPTDETRVTVYLGNIASDFTIYKVVADSDGNDETNILEEVSAGRQSIAADVRATSSGSLFAYNFKTRTACHQPNLDIDGDGEISAEEAANEIGTADCLVEPVGDEIISSSVASVYITDVETENVPVECPNEYPSTGMSADGVYLEVTDNGVGNNVSEPVAYYLDTHPGEFPFPNNRKYQLNVRYGGQLPKGGPTERTFVVDTSNAAVATLLKSPLWYAAKWGGFIEDENEAGVGLNKPDKVSEWDKNGDGEPDNFWLVTNASTLAKQLKDAFLTILTDAQMSNTAFAVSSGDISTGSLLFRASYESGNWSGDIQAYSIAEIDKVIHVQKAGMWSVRDKMQEQFADSAAITERLILTMAPNNDPKVFTAEAMKSDIAAISGKEQPETASLINYIRGDKTHELDGTFRVREAVNATTKVKERFILGDIVHSSPAYSGKPASFYGDQSYRDFYTEFENRTEVLVFGANDGMVHVVDASKDGDNAGQELFAYLPRQMYRADNSDTYLAHLADFGFNNAHKYYVDGPITIADVSKEKDGVEVWHTLAIGSLGGGGKGYYALDITDPDPTTDDALTDGGRFTGGTTPVLWEKSDLGHIYGKAVVGKLNSSPAKWVALLANGYGDNNSPLTPQLHIVDAIKGESISVIDINDVTTTCGKAGGLSAVTAVSEDGTLAFAYAGDLNGNLWKFDLRDPDNIKVHCLFTAKYFDPSVSDDPGTAQPITAAPSIGYPPFGIKGYMLYFGTGKFLENGDLSDKSKQSFYGVVDNQDDEQVGVLVPATSLAELEVAVTDSGVERTITLKGDAVINFTAASGYNRGYFLVLPTSGERIITESSIFDKKVTVGSILPTGGASCETGCLTWLMNLNLFSGVGTGALYESGQAVPPLPGPGGYIPPLPPKCKDTDCDPTAEQEPEIESEDGDCEYSVVSDTNDVILGDPICKGNPLKSWRSVY